MGQPLHQDTISHLLDWQKYKSLAKPSYQSCEEGRHSNIADKGIAPPEAVWQYLLKLSTVI